LIDDFQELNLPYAGDWLYVMATRADPSRSKIGITTGNPLFRLSQLRCGDPYLVFYAAFLIPHWFETVSRVEADVHSELSQQRIKFFDTDTYSEWFRVQPADVVNHLVEHFEEVAELKWCARRLLGLQKPGEQERIWMCYGHDIAECWKTPVLDDD
jgi:hypothetical protein